MKRPLDMLKEQVMEFLERASADKERTVCLSKHEFELFKFSFGGVCYEVQYGKLDEVYVEFFKTDTHQDGRFEEHDLVNLLQILNEMKSAY